MNVLVTGGGGFIGSHLVEDQLHRGRKVSSLDLQHSFLQPWSGHPYLQLIHGDIRDTALLRQALDGVDVVFHLASAHLSLTTSEEDYWAINVKATEELVRLCQRAGVKRFIHCSSVGVHGEIATPPADEDSPCRPDLLYEKTKLAGEQAIARFSRETAYPIAIVRPVWVYGPRCPRTAKLFRAIRKGRFIMVGAGQTWRHCVYISDLLEGLNLCAERDEAIGETFIIGDDAAVTVQQLVAEIATVMSVPPPRIRLPLALMVPVCIGAETVFTLMGKEPPLSRRSLKFFTNNTSFDVTKAKALLQFAPQVTLREGLRRTYEYLAKAGQV
jgi:nucleoside-diphosphate-sugar epimerase